MEKEIYSIRDTCGLLGFGETKIRDLIATKALDAVKIGGSTRVTAESIRRLVATAPPLSPVPSSVATKLMNTDAPLS